MRFQLYWKFMCSDKNNDKNKMNVSPHPFHSFLNSWKTATSAFCEKLSVIAWVDYFVLQISWRWVEKNYFFNFMDVHPLQTKKKVKYPHNKCKGKSVLTETILKLTKSRTAKNDFSKKCHVIFKKFLLLLWTFLSCLVRVPSFKSKSVLSWKIWCPFYKVI